MNQYIALTIQYFETFKNKDYDKMASFLKDHTQYHNWTQTYVGIDKIIETNKHIIDNAKTNFEIIIKTIGQHDKTISPINITFIEITFKTDGRYNNRTFTIEWDNDLKINRINGFVQMNSVTTCGSCGGVGKVVLEVCLYCLGNGLIPEEDIIDVNIPAGASDGMQFVVSGKGNEGKGNGKSGDLYVKIKEIPNTEFIRKGVDLITSKQITFIEAILGTNIDVEMPDGEKVKTVVSPGTVPGTILSFAQKGVPVLGYGGIGNFLVELNIKIPENLTDDQKKFLEELKENEIFN